MVFYSFRLEERISSLKKLLSTDNLNVKLNNKLILKNISIDIYSNRVIGLVGPNGAGKTTLIHSILGLNPINRGKINYYSDNKISYCPDTPEFEEKLTCYEIMLQSLLLSGNSIINKQKNIYNMLKKVGLEENIYEKVQGFSRGMKQRLGIASSLILNPDLIFLDEPTSALDPIGKEEIIKLIKIISKDVTIVLSSHDLNDVQKIASELIVINSGTVIYKGNISDFLSKTESYSIISFKNKESLLNVSNLFRKNDIEIKNTDFSCNKIEFNQNDFEELIDLLNSNCYGINEVIRHDSSLNDSFINYLKDLEK